MLRAMQDAPPLLHDQSGFQFRLRSAIGKDCLLARSNKASLLRSPSVQMNNTLICLYCVFFEHSFK